MRTGLPGLALAAMFLFPSSNAQAQAVAWGDRRIESSAPAIRADIEFLVDDLLEGREAGSRPGQGQSNLLSCGRRRLEPAFVHAR